MELLTVNRKDYSIGNLVELNWETDSLTWTERFQPMGDFELVTESVSRVMRLLPERSMCTLRDSNEVMWVDSHDVKTDETTGIETLTVKGRTLDWILMRRVWMNAPNGKKINMAKHYTVRQAVETWVWNAICNGTGNDRINPPDSYPVGNQLPNVVVTDSIPAASDGASQARKVQNGDVYSQMQTFLSSGQYGVRIIRPNGTKGRIVHIDTDGTFHSDSPSSISDLRFDFYRGRDISDNIVFSYKVGDLVGPEYLLDSTALMTGCYVDGDPRTHYYTNPDILAGSNTGWNRLDGYVDGGQWNEPTQHTGESDADFAARKAAAKDDFENSLEDQGKRTIRHDGQRITAVDATISLDSKLKYGRNYHLGDQVMVQGKYGAHDKKWVTEYIRQKDSSGETGAPTLSTTLS